MEVFKNGLMFRDLKSTKRRIRRNARAAVGLERIARP
jgi:hypothetical protein